MTKIYLVITLVGKVASFIGGWPDMDSCHEGQSAFEESANEAFNGQSTFTITNENGVKVTVHRSEIKAECKELSHDPELEY